MQTRNIVPAAVVLLGLALVAAPAGADAALEARGAYFADAEEPAVGGGFLTDLGANWDLNPNAEWVFTDGYDYATVNGDFHYDFQSSDAPAMWIGGGPALLIRNYEGDADDTDFGLNLIAGVGAKSGDARPFGQFKTILSDNTEVTFAMGVRF